MLIDELGLINASTAHASLGSRLKPRLGRCRAVLREVGVGTSRSPVLLERVRTDLNDQGGLVAHQRRLRAA
jgi:hypothetical protein